MLPSRFKSSLMFSAASPYASSCFAPSATPFKSKGVLAAVSIICPISLFAFSALPSIVVNDTSSCWNSPRTLIILLTNSLTENPAASAAAFFDILSKAASMRSPSLTTVSALSRIALRALRILCSSWELSTVLIIFNPSSAILIISLCAYAR